MNRYRSLLFLATLWVVFLCLPVAAQWQIPNHSVPIGVGTGTGFRSTAPGSSGSVLTSNGAAVDPSFKLPLGVSVTTFGAACNGSTIDTAAFNSALASGAQVITVPIGATCQINGLVTVPTNVTLAGAAILRRPVVSRSATGTVALNSAVIPMTTTTGINPGDYVYDQTLGYPLPGTVLSVNPGVSITMTVAVGNAGTPTSVTTSAATAAGSATLTITSSILTNPVIAQYGMVVYNVTQGRQLPGTVLSGTPYSTTTVVMTANVGAAGVGSGDVLTFGYPVTSGDVLKFASYRGPLVKIDSRSTVDGLTFDEGGFDGGPTNYNYLTNAYGSITADTGSVTVEWAVRNVTIKSAGRFGVFLVDAHSYRIENLTYTQDTPSDKNGSQVVYSHCFGGRNASTNGLLRNVYSVGAGIIQCDSSLTIDGFETTGVKYGAGIACSSDANCYGWRGTNISTHHGAGTDSNKTTVSGIEFRGFASSFTNVHSYANAGPGILIGGKYNTISSALVYDNSVAAVGNPGVFCSRSGTALWQDCSGLKLSGVVSGNLLTSSQSYGYLEDSASITNVTISADTTFPGNATAPTLILGSSTYYVSGSGNVCLSTSCTLASPRFTTSASPATSDGASLGTTTLQWADLFLAAGGVINWANGGNTLTQGSGVLTFDGSAGVNAFKVNGPNTGTAAGAYISVTNGGGAVFYLGNYSAIVGGAYDASMTMYGPEPLKFFIGGGSVFIYNANTASTSATTGALVVQGTGGLGVGGTVSAAGYRAGANAGVTCGAGLGSSSRTTLGIVTTC